jgi:outer membrane protein
MKSCNLSPRKHSLWLLLTVMSVTVDCTAQKSFTINECVQYAFEHNPLVNVAAHEIMISDIDIQRTKGTFLPRVNFASAFQYYFTKRQLLVEGGNTLAPPTLPDGEPMAIKTGYNNSWYPTFNINQQIFNPSYRSSYEISLKNKNLQEQQYVSFKIDLIAGIYKAFNTCKLLEIQINFLQANIARIDTLIDLTRTKFEKGAGVKLEVNRVEWR